MNRLFILLICCPCCSATHGYPAPKPKEPPTSAELVVGVWEAVLLWGETPVECIRMEFTTNWELFETAAGREVRHWDYLIITGPSKNDEIWIAGPKKPSLLCQLQSVSAREMVFSYSDKSKSVFKRK